MGRRFTLIDADKSKPEKRIRNPGQELKYKNFIQALSAQIRVYPCPKFFFFNFLWFIFSFFSFYF